MEERKSGRAEERKCDAHEGCGHGGERELSSSLFAFRCPCYSSSAAAAEPFLAARVDPRGVLPVEDEESAREPARDDRPLSDPPMELPMRRSAPPIFEGLRVINLRRGGRAPPIVPEVRRVRRVHVRGCWLRACEHTWSTNRAHARGRNRK